MSPSHDQKAGVNEKIVGFLNSYTLTYSNKKYKYNDFKIPLNHTRRI